MLAFMKKAPNGLRVVIHRDDAVRTHWSTFHRILCSVTMPDGTEFEHEREFLNRGNAIALLPYCKEHKTVILTKQFRLPAYMNDPADGILLEVCGGMRVGADSEEIAKQEAQEEIGLALSDLRLAFTGYSSPGSVTEKIDYYLSDYSSEHKQHRGGGVHAEGEHITIIEMPLDSAFDLIGTGGIRDVRTIALLAYLRAELATGSQL